MLDSNGRQNERTGEGTKTLAGYGMTDHKHNEDIVEDW
jgi:hypothetical protein